MPSTLQFGPTNTVEPCSEPTVTFTSALVVPSEILIVRSPAPKMKYLQKDPPSTGLTTVRLPSLISNVVVPRFTTRTEPGFLRSEIRRTASSRLASSADVQPTTTA